MKQLFLLFMATTLIGCGSGESSPVLKPNCTIQSMNGADAPSDSEYNSLADDDGNFFGDVLAIKANCTASLQIKGLTWELVESPAQHEVELFRDGFKPGNISDNKLIFWKQGVRFDQDGKYVVSVTATDRDGNTSSPTLLEIDYVAAVYISGEYLMDGTYKDIVLDDTDRPYYVASVTTARSYTIEKGVDVYSNDCNGSELSGYGCEMVALEHITINGTESEPVTYRGAVLRGAETRHAILDIDHARLIGGSINHHNNPHKKFSQISISNTEFIDYKGIVLTGTDDVVENSSFTNVAHDFTNDHRLTAIEIIDAENVLVKNNHFNDIGVYAVGISNQVTTLPVHPPYVVGNSYTTDIDSAIFDGLDATRESHGDNVDYVATIVSSI